MTEKTPIRSTDQEAIDLAKELISKAKFGSLAVKHPQSGHPYVTRIAVSTTADGTPLTLVSDLSTHTKALLKSPDCALLLGEPRDRGDPLTHPRITLACIAQGVEKSDVREHYLQTNPKAKLYVDFADFRFMKLTIQSADLNGGFGKAFQLTPQDLGA